MQRVEPASRGRAGADAHEDALGDETCTTVPQGIQEEIVVTDDDGKYWIPVANAGSFSLSVEDRARLEMQENAVNMAREHPEDVAQLIRTWLLEE